jgi:hypothetical protein
MGWGGDQHVMVEGERRESRVTSNAFIASSPSGSMAAGCCSYLHGGRPKEEQFGGCVGEEGLVCSTATPPHPLLLNVSSCFLPCDS